MEVAGAFGSVLQIAQVGAQLSLNLFKIAPNVGSANRDVQYFAKHIALFSTVLKDLGDRLSRGQTSDLYRDDAYQAGFGIAKECKEIFEEIQSNLDRFNKNGGATPGIFRKSRVQLLRGKLGFLESKILLQVAVLSYAEKASASSNSAADIDGLFELKSLVLANETTKAAFQELFTKSTEGSSSRNPIPISDGSTSGYQSSATAAPTFLSIAEILHESEPAFPQSRATKELPVFGNKPTLSTYSPPPSRWKTYANVWSTVDRLELALRKVETAQWEQERLQTILASRETSKPVDWTEREKTYLSKFRKSLIRFGLEKEKINQAIASVMIPPPNAGMRTEVEQVVSQNDVLFATLHHFGASWQNDKNNADSRIFKRWIPDYLEDILWEKIYKTFETAANSKPSGSYINTADSVIISDSEEKSLAQKHQAIREAIDQVNQSSMAIDRLDAPQNVHHLRPIARQSQSRQTYLTVPASESMLRRATLAMNPPPKSSSYAFSSLERSTSDAVPDATNPKMEMDGPRSHRERPTTLVASTRPPTLIVIGDEDAPGRLNRYRPTENTQRSSDANPLRYGGVHSFSDRNDFSTSTGTRGTNDHHQYDPPTSSTPFLLPSPSLKRKSPKEDESITRPSTSQQPDKTLPQTTSIQDPRQWFESEKHDKTSQTVRELLKRWTFLDLGDEDDDETRDDPHRGQGDDEDSTRVRRARVGAGGAEGERLESKGHRRGGDGDGGGDGGERAGDADEDGGLVKRRKVRRS